MTTTDNPKVSTPSSKDEDPKETGFFNQPRRGGKSIWDWLDLIAKLAIPVVVVGATIAFGLLQAHFVQQQHDTDQQRALDQQQATTLQTYIDNIQALLLNHNLLKSKPGDDVAILARARTLTALQGLDPERKGVLLNFLYEAHLIGYYNFDQKKPLAALIDLSFANLSGANLSFVNLSGANLSGANLSGANLSGVGLGFAKLHEANLRKAKLHGADLSGADLSGADLSGADLSGADLSGATIFQPQLDVVFSCQGAILPKGLTCHRNPSG